MRITRIEAFKAHELERALGLVFALAARHPAQVERELHIGLRRVSHGNRLAFLEHHADAVGIRVGDTGLPPMLIVPERMLRKPAIIIKSEDLPQPDGPTSTTNEPDLTSKDTSETASVSLWRLCHRPV